MGIIVERAGLQTTLQGRSRIGWRHMGIPQSGPADSLSMAFANRLVGKPSSATALEVTLTGAQLRFETPMAFSVTGPASLLSLSSRKIELHRTHYANAGDILELSAPAYGCRHYIAISDDLIADTMLGSESTYLPASFGGYAGRALKDNDRLDTKPAKALCDVTSTPDDLIIPISGTIAIQACEGPDFLMLDRESQLSVFRDPFTLSNRASRMGVELLDQQLTTMSGKDLDSAAVFPGTLQCPPSGMPYLLSVDAQTTGGYPHVLQVSRSDLHLIGQLRPGMKLQFLRRTPENAHANLKLKHRALSEWLPDYRF